MTRAAYTPRVFFDKAINHITSAPRTALWAKPGMGKTSIALTYLDSLIRGAREAKHALVLGPLRVAQEVWTDEASKWEHLDGLRVVSATGPVASRREALARRAHVTAINYEQLPWLIDTLGDDWFFDAVVADESTKLKGFRLRQGGQRAASLAKNAHTKVHFWLNLTGTPSPNGLVDLWGQTWFLDAGQRLGRSFSAFQARFFTYRRRPNAKNQHELKQEPLPYADEQIKALLSDICMTLDPRDYFDIKEPVVTDIPVRLPPLALAKYREFEKELFLQLQTGGVEAMSAAAKTMKCLQLANGAAYVDDTASRWEAVHDAKLDALGDLSEELDEPLLVAYHFRADRERLLARFPGALDLSKPDDMRRAKAGYGRLWLGHPAGMGHGVDGLQHHCRAVCFFGHWWDAEHYEQIIERVGPMRQLQAGHDRNVLIYNLIAESTMDAAVSARRSSKLTVQQALLEYMKGVS